MKVVHIITGLTTGGAEMMLFKLLSAFRNSEIDGEVISLLPEGEVAECIRGIGVPVRSAGISGYLSSPRGLLRLASMLKKSRPDLVHCWMYHANLVGGLAARMAAAGPILWGLRNSNLDPGHTPAMTRWLCRLGARFSGSFPDRVLCVSDSAAKVHLELGYCAERMKVIPNGFDFELFRPDPSARSSLRQELGLSADSLLVGLVARFDPQKDHGTFLRAASELAGSRPKLHFLMAGSGADGENAALAREISKAGLEGRVHALGLRRDVARLTAALDVAVSSSAFGEGFSNSIGEALACEIPAAVTDVGDSAEIVGESGRVVPVRDPRALAEAVAEILDWSPQRRAESGARGRRRMREAYGIDAIAARYREEYQAVLAGRPGASSLSEI